MYAQKRQISLGKFHDVEIFIVGKDISILAHKLILSRKSRYFETQFSNDWTGSDECFDVSIYDFIEANTIESFFSLLYVGILPQPDIVESNWFDLMLMADFFDAEEVKEKIKLYIMRNTSVCPKLLILYQKFQKWKTLDIQEFSASINKLLFYNFQTVIDGLNLSDRKTLCEFTTENLELLLRENLNASEHALFNFIMSWAFCQSYRCTDFIIEMLKTHITKNAENLNRLLRIKREFSENAYQAFEEYIQSSPGTPKKQHAYDMYVNFATKNQFYGNSPNGDLASVQQIIRSWLEVSDSNSNTARRLVLSNGDGQMSPLAKHRIKNNPYTAAFCIGGWQGTDSNDPEYGPCDKIHIWNDSSNVWHSESIKMPAKVCYHGTAFAGKYLYVFGGYNGDALNNSGVSAAFRLSITKNEWEKLPNLFQKRLYIAGASTDTGTVLAIGGNTDKNEHEHKSYINDSGRCKIVEEYLPERQIWRRLPDMLEHRSDASAVCMQNFIFVAGGFNGDHCLKSVEVYDYDNHQWFFIDSLVSPRSGLCLLIYQDHLLAIGGFGGNKNTRHDDFECLPVKNFRYSTWRKHPAKLEIGRSNFGATVINNSQILVCGGFNNGTLESCERWNGSLFESHEFKEQRSFKKDGWHAITPLPIAVSATSVKTINSTEPLEYF